MSKTVIAAPLACRSSKHCGIWTVTEDHERFAQLLNTQDPGKEEDLIMCGGQRTAFPRRYLVDFQTALIAAVQYLSTAQPAPELSWERNG